MALALREGRGYNDNEIVIERPDGTRRSALAYANPTHDESGTLRGGVNVLMDITIRKQAEASAALVAQLRSALAEPRALPSFIPICCHCKKVRDEAGAWRQVEEYFRPRTRSEFTHGICPGCMSAHYQDFLPRTGVG
jgi:hypothetical protein